VRRVSLSREATRTTLDRTAVFVDAGYLFASGSRLISGEKLTRSQLHLEHEAILARLTQLAQELTGLPVLRIYWYDGASSGPNSQHIALAYRPSLKLRLGLVNEQGQQEGVDQLIVADMITLSRNRAMADAVLLSGDDDLRPGVEEAQALGARVHLLGIAPARENQAATLVQAADSVRELSENEVREFLSLPVRGTSSRRDG
jgi:uncharacterized LabA/DUF88 family protein